MNSDSKLALLDRDGTLIEHIPYLSDPSQVRLLPGAVEGLLELRRRHYKLVMVSNQSGVGRGYFAQEQVEKVNQRLQDLLAPAGAQLDLMLYCPHAPQADCSCRKPRPGLALTAVRRLNCELQGGLVIGDSDCDMDLALELRLPGLRMGSSQLPGWSHLTAALDQLQSPLNP